MCVPHSSYGPDPCQLQLLVHQVRTTKSTGSRPAGGGCNNPIIPMLELEPGPPLALEDGADEAGVEPTLLPSL